MRKPAATTQSTGSDDDQPRDGQRRMRRQHARPGGRQPGHAPAPLRRRADRAMTSRSETMKITATDMAEP